MGDGNENTTVMLENQIVCSPCHHKVWDFILLSCSDCVPDCGNLIFYCLPRQVGLFTLPLCALIALCRFHLACLSLCGTNLSPSLVSAISSSYYPLSSVFSTPFHRSLYLVVCYFICWFLLWVSRSWKMVLCLAVMAFLLLLCQCVVSMLG